MKFLVEWEATRTSDPYPVMQPGYVIATDEPEKAALMVAQYLNLQGDFYVTELPVRSGQTLTRETLRVLITLQAYKDERG